MTHEQFMPQLARLQAEWKTAYGPERIKLLWDVFKREDEDLFKSAVSYCLGHHRQAPLVKELNEALGEVRRQNAITRSTVKLAVAGQKDLKLTGCHECSGGGYTTRDDEKGYRYLYRCACSAGSAMPDVAYGPTRTDGNREEIYVGQAEYYG